MPAEFLDRAFAWRHQSTTSAGHQTLLLHESEAGPHLFYNAATGDRFKDLKTGFKNAVKEAHSGIT
jgi:hypothetical protein